MIDSQTAGYRFTDEPLNIRCHKCSTGAYESRVNNGVFWCPECQRARVPYVTGHALEERWAKFVADSSKVKPEILLEAWKTARPVVQDPRDWTTMDPEDVSIGERIGHRFDSQQVRFHRPTLTILVLSEDTLKTVVDVTDARLNAKVSVVQTYLADDESERVTREVADQVGLDEEWYSTVVEREKLRRGFVQDYIDSDTVGTEAIEQALDGISETDRATVAVQNGFTEELDGAVA